MYKKTLAVAVLFAISGSPVMAGGIPTIDVANIVQTTQGALNGFDQIANQVKQIQNQVNQLKQLQQRVEQAKKQFESMTGNYGMGDLIGGADSKKLREWGTGTWDDILDDPELKKVADATQEENESVATDEIYQNPDSVQGQLYNKRGKEIYATRSVGQHSYNLTGDRIKRIDELAKQIELANDPKQAMDLGNTIQAQLAYLMAESVRLQSARLVQASNTDSYHRNVEAERKVLTDKKFKLVL